MTTSEIIAAANSAKAELASMSSEDKNRALEAMACGIDECCDKILFENFKDMEAAKGRISEVMADRLRLDWKRVRDMSEGIRALVKLDDPVGRVLSEQVTENGLKIRKITVPMGVIAVIYESRPNVTADAAALCLKSGSACILRGGKEAFRSSHAITAAMRMGLSREDFSQELINILYDTGREGANELMKAHGLVDLLIPRGGAGLIKSCIENATVPCIETGTGICSVYVDKDANMEKALRIIKNAKTQRPSVCNAEEVCLVAADIAEEFLPRLKKELRGVELRLCPRAMRIIEGTPASESDFDTEFLDHVLAVKLVEDVKEAAAHISLHSTHHSDAIVTENKEAADYFTKHVDSAAVYVNSSTRFTDGGCFGLGCEMGISTQKLHARGPMGLNELVSYKYVIIGDGQIRE